MVAPHNEVRTRELMLSLGMAVLIEEDAVARRTDGRLLLGGMFRVAHKELSDRLIFDRSPQNANEARCPFGQNFQWGRCWGSCICEVMKASKPRETPCALTSTSCGITFQASHGMLSAAVSRAQT